MKLRLTLQSSTTLKIGKLLLTATSPNRSDFHFGDLPLTFQILAI